MSVQKWRKLAIAALIAATLTTVNGQTLPSFEVAAIRQNRSGTPNTNIRLLEGGRFEVVNGTVKTLIRNAYGILGFQFSGGLPWLDTEYYDIEAKTSRPEELTNETIPKLLQSLLADRFKLKVHWETREGPVYTLTLDKAGPKFGPSVSSGNAGMNTSKGPGHARMIGTKQSMALLASNLGNQLGRYVLNQTGLIDSYDFSFEWDPEQLPGSTSPSIFTALQEQLGLRLEAAKGSMPILVIDSAERPAPN